MNKIKKGSEIHQKYDECLHNVEVEPNSGIVTFDFHIQIQDTLKTFGKYIKETGTNQDVFLIDEILARTLKSHYETVYCMRYLSYQISIVKLVVKIEIQVTDMTRQLNTSYELIEKGYPNEEHDIYDLCGQQLKLNGGYWKGVDLKEYIEKHKIN